MGTSIVNFADQLYSFLALKYEIFLPKNSAEGGPPAEECDWPSEEFTIDIARAVMMLSYTYRSSFTKHFSSVATLLCASKDKPKLYASIFARVTYVFHSPLKILILCSFISEMYMFICYQKGPVGDLHRHYRLPAMECLRDIYLSVLRKIDDPIPKWDDVKRAAALLAKGYGTMEPIIRTEHPWESKDFFTSVQDVLEEQSQIGRGPEGASRGSGNSAASAPSTSKPYFSTETSKFFTDQQRRLEKLLEANQLADQLKQASLTESDSPIGKEKPKSHVKKSSSQPLKTKACAKSAESGNQAMTSTSTANSFIVEYSLVSMGKKKTVHKTTIKPIAKNTSSSFGAVDDPSQRVPGAQFYEDHKSEKTNESQNKIVNETRSGSSVAKSKSKKHKKKKGKK